MDKIIVEVKAGKYTFRAYQDKRYVEVFEVGSAYPECPLTTFWFDTFAINNVNQIKQYIYGYCFQYYHIEPEKTTARILEYNALCGGDV